MVVIRLARGGANKRPFYRLVVADKRCRRDGRNIEQIGFYNPIATERDTKFSLKADRLEHWLSVGAQMSPRVEELVKAHKKAGAKTAAAPVVSAETVQNENVEAA
jgi:small subunit ribosomal protein S16